MILGDVVLCFAFFACGFLAGAATLYVWDDARNNLPRKRVS